ncbi:hypothetical protein VNO77_31465 [Canavalia gladiata]|uniref:FAF domain-containing protein n=1 Tax=Canavalia gladiata TaxID=3824 RepID=A0AAN9KPN5_CANGL
MLMKNNRFPPNGDAYTGTKSCIDLQNKNINHDHITSKSIDANVLENQVNDKNNIKKKEKKVFPPPIPLLARTQNLASHMPWVLKRYYTSEGRLILKEEKVRHHEYFQAHRANGRLTLQLVPFDHYNECFWNSEVEAASPTSPHQKIDDDNVTLDQSVIAGNGRPKRLNFSGVRSSPSCIFGVKVHPVRTVHG